jgi:hypothetical protein
MIAAITLAILTKVITTTPIFADNDKQDSAFHKGVLEEVIPFALPMKKARMF